MGRKRIYFSEEDRRYAYNKRMRQYMRKHRATEPHWAERVRPCDFTPLFNPDTMQLPDHTDFTANFMNDPQPGRRELVHGR